jgi:hypothetical protein
LPNSKQGVASAVNDTTREIGTALGIAIMGSTFNTGYRRELASHLSGVPHQTATEARQAPGIALEVAQKLGRAGDALAAAARDAFTSGMRLSMLFGAGLLLAAAAFLVLHGPSRGEERAEDAIDEPEPEMAVFDLGELDEPTPVG